MPTAYQGWGREYDLVSQRWTTQMGMEPRWSWGSVQSFRAIAAEGTAIELPSDPYLRSDQSAHPGQRRASKEITYWTALHTLLTCRLGWDRPGKGIIAAMEKDHLDDATWDLVQKLWIADGHIDVYLEIPATQSGLDEPRDGWGDTDPFHFESHVRQGWRQDDPLTLVTNLFQDEFTHRLALVFESGKGWVAALHRLGAQLPNSGDSSRRIDVFVKPIGFMGTYRQSRVTGRWFTGKHSVHMLGHD